MFLHRGCFWTGLWRKQHKITVRTQLLIARHKGRAFARQRKVIGRLFGQTMHIKSNKLDAVLRRRQHRATKCHACPVIGKVEYLPVMRRWYPHRHHDRHKVVLGFTRHRYKGFTVYWLGHFLWLWSPGQRNKFAPPFVLEIPICSRRPTW